MYNSKFSEQQLSLINEKQGKYRLFYALLFKYYEINTEFFESVPKFSGSLITNIAKLLNIPRTISIPAKSTLGKYQFEIKSYFGSNKKHSEELVRQYVLEILPAQRSFDIDTEEVADYLKKNKMPPVMHLDRLVSRVIKEYEDILFSKICDGLNSESKAYLDGLLMMEQQNSVMAYVKSWPQGISLKSILGEADKLRHLKYGNLADIMSKPINWEVIEKYYDQIVKYSVALRQGRSDAENIMRIFTRNNAKHPVYKALRELGRAVKTIFLCKYLGSEPLRQEIHEGLNVVERWNGTNDFIFYGKRRVLTGTNPAEFELQMLCLHLLQLSMVYINTLLLQQILVESKWLERMTMEDKRALTPLLSEHINPYGLFVLDMNKRLDIKMMGAA